MAERDSAAAEGDSRLRQKEKRSMKKIIYERKCRIIWRVLKINFHLSIRNHLLLAILYLLFVPVLRGIENLDAARSAECLEQSVSLIGILLLVPLRAPEQPGAIRDAVFTRKIPGHAVLLLRFAEALVLLAVLTAVFAGIMKMNGCTFPYVEYVFGTVVKEIAVGVIGFLTAVRSNSMAAGYLVAAGLEMMLGVG